MYVAKSLSQRPGFKSRPGYHGNALCMSVVNSSFLVAEEESEVENVE